MLTFLGTLQAGLAARSKSPENVAVLQSIANRAEHIASRLSKPEPRDWRAFVKHVEQQQKHDTVQQFLFGANVGYAIDSVAFLRAMRDTVLAFAEFMEEPCNCLKHT
jgi:hypothetical protein